LFEEILGRAYLQGGCFLKKGRDISEFLALIFGFTKRGVMKQVWNGGVHI
jgi:hypothetical protein